eukprot:gnl/TRDRNA2_/TRDRNA2_177999_c1_seq2.p1 gnl/TRDRNA2_/TRDRNA2_177999_c1~~gnl/TRDRNA2_/TRDRNA2_177999_c1_seq2.p1  ORF type:complete len:606 (+),score=122.83 gnl/TRDRNA2_/TRDRNA2_177999_c1_seq2:103-1920(+)
MFRLIPARLLDSLLGVAAYSVWYLSLALYRILYPIVACLRPKPSSKHAGKTVLLTTGRQAKTLHGVRALKDIGCRVIVTDYQEMSCSAVSTACDAFYKLAPLDSKNVGRWVDRLEEIIVKENVDLVLPMSTINEALFIGAAKDWLQAKYPNVIFACEGLDMMAKLDHKGSFAKLCVESGVPVPEDGIVSSREELEKNIPFGKMDVIIKRIESTVNRDAEIKTVLKEDGVPPKEVNPTPADPWQWQRFIKGVEYSAWFVCFDGRITFQGCYRSEGDLLFFDGIPVPKEVEEPIARFVAKHRLTGQYAFDYFQETSTGRYFVIECNPRASSVLEGVSGTPGWAASFFGDDVRSATQYQKVGFFFHRNCWPFVADRSEGYLSLLDPLPLLVAEFAWPLELMRIKGALKGGALPREPKGIPIEAGIPLTAKFPSICEALGINYHHLDVNIGKIIVPGPTPGRDYDTFEAIQQDAKGSYIRTQVWPHGATGTRRVLCVHSDVADAIEKGTGNKKAQIKRFDEKVVRTDAKNLFKKLLDQGHAFEAIFLPQALLSQLPAGLRAADCRAVATEVLPSQEDAHVSQKVVVEEKLKAVNLASPVDKLGNRFAGA